MKVLGVGIDLIENKRMLKLINKENFVSKVLHPEEIEKFRKILSEQKKV